MLDSTAIDNNACQAKFNNIKRCKEVRAEVIFNQFKIDWMSAKAQAPSSLFDISFRRWAEWAKEISKGGRPGRFLDSESNAVQLGALMFSYNITKYCRVKLGTDRFSASRIKLPSNRAIPRVCISKETKCFLKKAKQ